MYGQTRHRLQRLASRARAGEITPAKVADAIYAILAGDMKLIEAEMARVRAGGKVKPDTEPTDHNPDLDALLE